MKQTKSYHGWGKKGFSEWIIFMAVLLIFALIYILFLIYAIMMHQEREVPDRLMSEHWHTYDVILDILNLKYKEITVWKSLSRSDSPHTNAGLIQYIQSTGGKVLTNGCFMLDDAKMQKSVVEVNMGIETIASGEYGTSYDVCTVGSRSMASTQFAFALPNKVVSGRYG
jgi:hypothetical protein